VPYYRQRLIAKCERPPGGTAGGAEDRRIRAVGGRHFLPGALCTMCGRRIALLILLTPLLLLLVGCWPGKQVAASTSACSIVTIEEAHQVLGVPVRAQPQQLVSQPKNATLSECLYTSASDNHFARASLALSIAADSSGAQQLYNQAKSTALDLGGAAAVSTDGDAAFQTVRSTSLGPETLLTVLKDNTVLTIEALSPGHRQLDLEQALARVALSRL
jgi:hypothetical protein